MLRRGRRFFAVKKSLKLRWYRERFRFLNDAQKTRIDISGHFITTTKAFVLPNMLRWQPQQQPPRSTKQVEDG